MKEELIQKYRTSIKNKIDWKTWEDKPCDGKEIWVLKWHNKGHFPSSFEIVGGEVESGNDGSWRVNTCDNDGKGSNCFYPNNYDDGFLYWCDKWEISIPEEMINWNHSPGVP